MGNTKSYYFEGELLPGTTLEQFKKAVYDGFHSTYCVAEIVEAEGGYLGGRDGGPYLLAAIHTYSTIGDRGPEALMQIFKEFRMHRVDSDWADCWIAYYDSSQPETRRFRQWRAHDSDWSADRLHSDLFHGWDLAVKFLEDYKIELGNQASSVMQEALNNCRKSLAVSMAVARDSHLPYLARQYPRVETPVRHETNESPK